MKRISLLLSIFAIPLFLLAQGMTPMDVAKLQFVGDAIISGDGNHIAYTLSVPADPFEENKPASTELWVYDIENETHTAYVQDGSVRAIAFRPEHRSITYLNRLSDDKTTALYEVPLFGGVAHKLYSFETSISAYEWASDGMKLAFIAEEKAEKESELPYADIYMPEIYELDTTFNRAWLVRLPDGEAGSLDVPGHVSAIKVSPDDRLIAVASAPSTLIDDYYMRQQLTIVNAMNLEPSRTVTHEGKLGEFVWNASSDKLAFIAGADINDPIDGRLFVVGDRGGTPRNLKPAYKGKFEDIAWADDHTIEFIASEGVDAVFGQIDSDGSDMEYTYQDIELNLLSFDRSADGAYVFSADHPMHPTEVYYTGETDDDPERITHHNTFLEDIEFGRQEVVTYEAEDGLDIQGILIYPLDYEEGRRYPLINVIHGGPESHYDNGWRTYYSQPGQVAAADGYLVFYPNYRGSTGRGHEFVLTSQADPAGKEFDDIVDGVDYLIEQGLADGDRVGVTGGSYGGYATGWMATKYTDRFAAGVMFVGISNKVSKWGTTDIPNEEYLVHARKWIYDDYQYYLERSPIYYAGQAKTPLLIAHGKEDPRVHPGQSMELYRHIRQRTDTPVRLVFYPGEGHGNRAATARYDYQMRMMRWFDKYLKKD